MRSYARARRFSTTRHASTPYYSQDYALSKQNDYTNTLTGSTDDSSTCRNMHGRRSHENNVSGGSDCPARGRASFHTSSSRSRCPTGKAGRRTFSAGRSVPVSTRKDEFAKYKGQITKTCQKARKKPGYWPKLGTQGSKVFWRCETNHLGKYLPIMKHL